MLLSIFTRFFFFHLYIYFGEMSVYVFSFFLIKLFGLFLLSSHQSSLYILNTSPLLWCIHTVYYYSVIKETVDTWNNLDESKWEIQMPKFAYYISPLISILEIKKYIYRTGWQISGHQSKGGSGGKWKWMWL